MDGAKTPYGVHRERERRRDDAHREREREAKLCAYNFSIVRVRAHETCLHYMLVLEEPLGL